MSELIKYTLEFPINSSINILYLRLSSPSGLVEWFADDIIIKDNIYTFFWNGSEQNAKLLKKNFRSVRSWPLAITAYNHGLQGMKRAKKKFGNNLNYSYRYLHK